MALKNNTWKLNQWYDQDVAGNVSYTGAGELFSWGLSNAGSLGLNQAHDTFISSPTQLPGSWGASSQFRAKRSQIMLFKTDGTLWVWGTNVSGQLGLNNTTQYSSPVQVPGTTWSTGAIGEQVCAGAIRTDGTLWMWGADSNGQLAQNNQTSYSSPKQVPGTTWSEIAGGEGFFLATKTDGTLWSWGENNAGQLGQNNKTLRSSPIQIPGTTWDQVAAVRDSCFARKTDGTIWSWGVNGNGTLGQNNRTEYSSPRQVGSDTTWANLPISVETGSSGPLIATKTDGTLWACGGQGDFGILGQNAVGDSNNRSSPVQIPGTTWSTTHRPTTSGLSACALRTDGTAWVWGANTGDRAGMLGLNDQVSRSSPTQLTGTDWKNMTVSQYGSFGIKEG